MWEAIDFGAVMIRLFAASLRLNSIPLQAQTLHQWYICIFKLLLPAEC